MMKKKLLQNQIWELKYQMLQAFCGLSSQELETFVGEHWPIGWHVQHCMVVVDFMINTHVNGDFALPHYPEYKQWPLVPPQTDWPYPSNLELQQKWVELIDGILNLLGNINDNDLDRASKTAYNHEPLIESFLRIINHTHSHIAMISHLTASIHSRLPEQGIWMPRSDLFSAIKTELAQKLARAGNSQSPVVRRIAKKYFSQISHHDIWTIIENCEDLMATQNTWLPMIANAWIERLHDRFQEYHFYHFERWLFLYINGWGTCDDLCKRTLNPFIQKYPGLSKHLLINWTTSANPWVRRASAVSMIRSENSRYVCDIDFTVVSGIAEKLFDDRDKFVQKAVGWVLKAASLKNKNAVIDFLKKNVGKMSRLSFRYAIENLSTMEKTTLMKLKP